MVDDNAEKSDSMECDDNIGVKKLKRRKPGIIYLSTLPPFMNVTKAKEIFSSYGDIGRIFLQPADRDETSNTRVQKSKNKTKPAVHFSEGWIEFLSKKQAKEVAQHLNNTQIGGKKKSKFYDYIWNIKYLPRFKWAHLSERLAYERAVHKQKLRAEIAQAKREANFFSANLESSKHLKKKLKDGNSEGTLNSYKQRETDVEIRARSSKEERQVVDRQDFLKSIFSNS